MTTATATSLETVQAFVAAIAQKDFDTALKYVAEDCEYENIPMSKVTGPARRSGCASTEINRMGAGPRFLMTSR